MRLFAGNGHPLARWLSVIVVLVAFALIDAAIVARPAGVVSPSQLLAGFVAFAIIAGGALYTAWWMEGR